MSLGSFSRDDNDRQRRAPGSTPARREAPIPRDMSRVRPTSLPLSGSGGPTLRDMVNERNAATPEGRERTRNQQLARVNRPGSPGSYTETDLIRSRRNASKAQQAQDMWEIQRRYEHSQQEQDAFAAENYQPHPYSLEGFERDTPEESRLRASGRSREANQLQQERMDQTALERQQALVESGPTPYDPRPDIIAARDAAAVREANVDTGMTPIPRDMARGPGERTRSLTTREPEFREMTWEEYDALDPRTRAAVDANTLLRETLDRDASVIEQFDRDGDGRLSMSEAAFDLHSEGRDPLALGNYANNYTGVFGRFQAAEDDPSNWNRSMSYAPNTLAALNFMGMRDDEGGLDDYLSGAAFVTDDDILRNRHRTEGGTGRDAMISNLSLNMESLNSVLAEGRMMIDNARQSTSFETADVSGLVESLSTGMLGGANLQAPGLSDEAIGDDILPDLSALANPEALQLDNTFNQMLSGMEAVAASYSMPVEELLTDQTFVEETMWSEFNVDATYEDWVAYLERVSQQRAAQANAVPAEGADEDSYQAGGV